MKKDIRNILVVGLIAFIVLSFAFSAVNAQDPDQEGREENFRDLLNGVDGLIRAIRFDREITENRISNLEAQYNSLFSDSSNSTLDSEIRNLFSDFRDPNNVTEEKARILRGKIEELGDSEGIGISFIYSHAIFVILGVSFALAFSVNMISRVVVDWEEVNAAKRKQSEIQDKLKKARKEGDRKKVRKYQQQQQDFMQEHMGTMFSPMKTTLIIFIPFIIVFRILDSTYGGWVVAWLPFNLPWPDIGFPLLDRFFKGTVASLGFFGWYLLVYFGLSQLMRKILVPSE